MLAATVGLISGLKMCFLFISILIFSKNFRKLFLIPSIEIFLFFCRMWHDTPVFISISELVLRALVLDQKRHGAKGSVGLDNADVGLILCSVIIRWGVYF